MTKPIHILSTKKLLPNQKRALLDANITLIEEDFIETKIKKFELFLRGTKQSVVNDNLIFTSQNAVKSVLQHPKCSELKNKNVFAVGLKTKSLLEENGFNVGVHTDYASDLAEIISLIYNKEQYTFFCGNLRRDVLPTTLKENGIKCDEIEVYETNLISKKVPHKFDGILFFSPSAVESYLKSNTIKNEMCFCIGETTAEALEEKEINNIIIADQPSVDNVIEEVIECYINQHP
ncbi:uroporphyrinogen-III synthase [Flavobacterium aciduliphilum]|uniref:Uroporphyrinogen-III synthase n=1 Tax=Flavobacterium aciduliphilum TaxID=1101402 RepID=A0A328YET9_9FLAO|nr:uroporphyrinogen-III synthase [Flavobacterium aciduliphilum]RAR71663.1 uroporphyrinogen-III synthase [Flavobacterium aciduliphilum]